MLHYYELCFFFAVAVWIIIYTYTTTIWIFRWRGFCVCGNQSSHYFYKKNWYSFCVFLSRRDHTAPTYYFGYLEQKINKVGRIKMGTSRGTDATDQRRWRQEKWKFCRLVHFPLPDHHILSPCSSFCPFSVDLFTNFFPFLHSFSYGSKLDGAVSLSLEGAVAELQFLCINFFLAF